MKRDEIYRCRWSRVEALWAREDKLAVGDDCQEISSEPVLYVTICCDRPELPYRVAEAADPTGNAPIPDDLMKIEPSDPAAVPWPPCIGMWRDCQALVPLEAR
jgi:hypothetical protein